MHSSAHRSKVLPSLAFGNSGATVSSSLNAFRDLVSQVRGGATTALESSLPNHSFRSATRSLMINDLLVVSSTVTPVIVESEEVPYCSLSILVEGTAISRQEKQRRHSRNLDPNIALWTTGGRSHTVTANVINELGILPDMSRLRRVAATMLGDMGDLSFIQHCRESKLVKLHTHGVDFRKILLNNIGTLDAVNLNAETLAQLGVDDSIYRTLAMMLAPDLFLGSPDRRQTSPTKHTLDIVREYIAANLGNTIVLSDLEAVSQLSRRALQYAFLKAYGCTPMAWVRQQRLHKAREHLLHAGPDITVLKIALDCGFVKPSTFAMYYRKQFGELPSETLTRCKRFYLPS